MHPMTCMQHAGCRGLDASARLRRLVGQELPALRTTTTVCDTPNQALHELGGDIDIFIAVIMPRYNVVPQ